MSIEFRIMINFSNYVRSFSRRDEFLEMMSVGFIVVLNCL
jgi:hypothetical protein